MFSGRLSSFYFQSYNDISNLFGHEYKLGCFVLFVSNLDWKKKKEGKGTFGIQLKNFIVKYLKPFFLPFGGNFSLKLPIQICIQ